MLWGSQRPIQIHLKQEGRVLTRDGSSVSGLIEPVRGSLSAGSSSSSSSPSSGSSPSKGNTDSPPTPSSTMPSRLSVSAASSAAFSSWRDRNSGENRFNPDSNLHHPYEYQGSIPSFCTIILQFRKLAEMMVPTSNSSVSPVLYCTEAGE